MNVLITGASSGIGLVTATYLQAKKMNVIGTSRNPADKAFDFPLIQLDVTNEESVDRCISNTLQQLKHIDVLINNAGYGIIGPIENTSYEEALQQFETNYFGVTRMNKSILPHFKSRNQGMIIHISSIGGLIGLPFQGHYSASKFALEGYAEALRLEMRPLGIKVVNINPGDYKTEFAANRKIISGITPEYRERFNQFLTMYSNDEQNGSDPIAVAKLIHRLILKKNGHAVRYLSGNIMQTTAAKAKNLLGNKLFEKILIKIWNA